MPNKGFPRVASEANSMDTSDSSALMAGDTMPLMASKEYKLMIHETSYHEAEMLVNPPQLPNVKAGHLLEVYLPNAQPEHRVVLEATLVEKDKPCKFSFSVLKSVADAFDLEKYQAVMMGQVNAKDVELDYVEFTIKDQFVPRADLYRFVKAVNGSTAFGGKTFQLQGVRARVQQVNRSKQPVFSGVISKRTHVSCRSRSSRIFWLVQLSIEMYDYAPNGDLHTEVLLNDFVRKVLDKWKALEVSHYLTVVLFSRTFFHTKEGVLPRVGLNRTGLHARPLLTASDGRLYEDVYKVVVHNEHTGHDGGIALLERLRREILAFPVTMGWCKKVDFDIPTSAAFRTREEAEASAEDSSASSAERSEDDSALGVAIPSYAAQGNFLEALNVTLNVLEKHYLDRDLTRSGNSIVTISAGTGVFEVDGRLSDITLQRMMDNGIGMDMVSLSHPPLHTAPLFICKKLVAVKPESRAHMPPSNSPVATPVSSVARGDSSPPPASSAAAAATRAAETAKQHYGASPGAAGGAGERRSSQGSEEGMLQEKAFYEVPHWMNLSFASAPHRDTPNPTHYGLNGFHVKSSPVPVGFAGGAPLMDDIDTGFAELPIPKLVDPPLFSVNRDGSMNMASISMPPVLAHVLGIDRHRYDDGIDGDDTDGDGAADHSPEDAPTEPPGDKGEDRREDSSPKSSREPTAAERSTSRYFLPYSDDSSEGESDWEYEDVSRPTEKTHWWGNFDKVWPQPAPGIGGLMATGPNTSNAKAATVPPSNVSTPTTLIYARPGARLPAPVLWSCGQPGAMATTPPVPCVGQRSKSPTSAAAAAIASRGLSEVTLGTSPGTGFVGSPGSLGMQSLTLEHLSRPFPDRESKVGAGPQASLRSSPRGNSAGSGPHLWESGIGANGTRDGRALSESLSLSGRGTTDRGQRAGTEGGRKIHTTSMSDRQLCAMFEAHDNQLWKSTRKPKALPDAQAPKKKRGAQGTPTGPPSRSSVNSGEDGRHTGDVSRGRRHAPTQGMAPSSLSRSPATTMLRDAEKWGGHRPRYQLGDGRLAGGDMSTMTAGSPSHRADASGADSDVSSVAESPMLDSYFENSPSVLNQSTSSIAMWQPPRDQYHNRQQQYQQQHARSGRDQYHPDSRYPSSPQQQTFRAPVNRHQYSVLDAPNQRFVHDSRDARDGRDAGIHNPHHHSRQAQSIPYPRDTYWAPTPAPAPAPAQPRTGISALSLLTVGKGASEVPTAQQGIPHFTPPTDSSSSSRFFPAPAAATRTAATSEGSTPVASTRPVAPRIGGGSSGMTGRSGSGGASSSSQQQRPLSKISKVRSAPMKINHDADAIKRAREKAIAKEAKKAGGGSEAVTGRYHVPSSPQQAIPPRLGVSGMSSRARAPGEGQHGSGVVFEGIGHARSSSGGFPSSSYETEKEFRGDELPILRTPRMGEPRSRTKTSEIMRMQSENSNPDREGVDGRRVLTGAEASGRNGAQTGSDAGTGSPTGRGWVGETEFNPFKRRDEKELLRTRNHNRRRWSHVFPPGQEEFKTMPGPIWRSLCQPALLPLSTDFVPNAWDIVNNYQETNYKILLQINYTDKTARRPDHMVARNVKPLLEEMCCQRIAQDFQLVERVASGAAPPQTAGAKNLHAPTQAYDSLARRAAEMAGPGQKHAQAQGHGTGRSWKTQGGRIVYILSMGHRLQTLSYDTATNTVAVKKYLQKEGINLPANRYEYKYSLWLPQMGHVQTIQQIFFKFPNPEYNFNYVDNLLSGYRTQLTESTKFRRLLFAIIPPEVTSKGVEDTFVAAMQKLADHLNGKKQPRFEDDLGEEQAPISFQFKRTFPDNSVERDYGTRASAPDDPTKDFGRQALRMDVSSATNDGALSNEKPRYEWLDVVYDKIVDVNSITQLDVRWLVCSGASVAQYVTALHRCAKDLQLCLVQVPEYATGTHINLHPYITHPYIQVPPCSSPKDVDAIVKSVKWQLQNTQDFVRCRDVRTEWKAFGLGTPEEGGLGGTLHRQGLDGSLPKPNRVYGHRTGAAFVRVAPGGFVFLENLHVRDTSNGQPNERGSDRAATRPGKRLQQTLLDDLRRLVVVTHFAHQLIMTTVDEALDQVADES